MVNIENLKKSFGTQVIYDKFSYDFSQNGLYVLFGESGCGKTTLLNLICGIDEFDSGSITINNHKYSKSVDFSAEQELIGYMTQDSQWIDYLTIGEQLEMLGNSREEILEVLNKFNLGDLYGRYFSEISGGQKQRIFLSQLVLQNKRIILLDEPTASLDGDNKKIVFEMLSAMKENALIICSSHDKELLEYADYVLNYSDLDAIDTPLSPKEPNPDENTSSNKKLKNLMPYFLKWFKWENRERKSIFIMLIIYVLVFLSIFIADLPKSKEFASMQHLYRINQCVIGIDSTCNLFDEIDLKKYNIKDILLTYNGSCPDVNIKGEGIDTMLNVIPQDKDAFKYSDKIIYGSYFTGENQVILSYDKALEFDNPEKIIGETIALNMYDGPKEFEIVGIFDEFSDREDQYLNQSFAREENNYFISSDYTKKFINDDNYYWLGQRSYIIYFDSYKDMVSFVDENQSNKSFEILESNVDSTITQKIESIFYILLPCALVVSLCATLFYYQIKRVEMMYNSHLVSLYKYLGYKEKEIQKCWLVGNIIENSKILIYSGLAALIISLIFNIFNSIFDWFPFIVFTYNPFIILTYLILNTLFALLICFVNYKSISKINWYDLFLQQRDIL